MKLRLSLGVLAGALLMQTAGPAQARDMTTVWDIKQKCFRAATGGDCGNSYNVTTRTFANTAAQRAGAANADSKTELVGFAPTPASTALKPSQSLRELTEAETAPKQEHAEEQPGPAKPATPPAQAGAKVAATQDEWDVASPAKKPKTEPKTEAGAAAKPEPTKPAKSAESPERPRGIRKTTKSNG